MNSLFGELLPSWLDAELWAAFIDGRKKMGKRYAASEGAKKLILMELDRLRSQGHHPNEVLAQSIRRGYLDVFPIAKREFTPTIVSGVLPLAPVSDRKPESDEHRRRRLELAGLKKREG
jgi:hypothetical protein